MKHFGDITKIHGDKVPIVDIITGGSPCQDLSLAGKRAGLAGERSGLFIEQIRIIKEMRDESRRQLSIRRADVDIRDIRPRYMVWENVPGAFSSNGGEDFRAVLEETARISNPTASIPRLPSGESWSNAGCILGDRWSIAWRVHDAQFWGVPQRRRRISLIASFGDQSAPEILFERKSQPRNVETWKKCNDAASYGEDVAKASQDFCVFTPGSFMSVSTDDVALTLAARDYKGPQIFVNSKIARQLTPLEYERIDGFPDNWTNIGEWVDSKGKKHKDADGPRYKALGNSIALPFWQWMADRMCKQLREDGFEDLTMASLFDGIGGFPLVYSRCDCKPVWASEIEEFPIAVTKYHFGEE